MGSHYHLWPLCSPGERVGVKSRLCKTLVLTRAIQVNVYSKFSDVCEHNCYCIGKESVRAS